MFEMKTNMDIQVKLWILQVLSKFLCEVLISQVTLVCISYLKNIFNGENGIG